MSTQTHRWSAVQCWDRIGWTWMSMTDVSSKERTLARTRGRTSLGITVIPDGSRDRRQPCEVTSLLASKTPSNSNIRGLGGSLISGQKSPDPDGRTKARAECAVEQWGLAIVQKPILTRRMRRYRRAGSLSGEMRGGQACRACSNSR